MDNIAQAYSGFLKRQSLWEKQKQNYQGLLQNDFDATYNNIQNPNYAPANTGYALIDDLTNWAYQGAKNNGFASGLLDTGTTWAAGAGRLLGFDDFAQGMDSTKRALRINHDMNRGDSGFSNLAYGLGTIAPEMILPTGQIKLGAGIAGNALRGAGFGALGGGLTSLLDSDQSWQQALGGAALGAGAGGLLGAAGASVLGHFNGYGWGNSPKAGLLNSTIDDAGNIKIDPIVGTTNTNDDTIARAMNAQRTQPRWQTTEQMPQQMVGQPHWFPNAQAAQEQTQMSMKPNFTLVGEPKTINPIDAELELVESIAQQAKLDNNIIKTSLEVLRAKHPEMFKSRGDVFRLLREIKNNPNFVGDSLKDPNVAYLAKALIDGKVGDMAINRDTNIIFHANRRRFMKNDESMVGSPTVPTQPSSSRGVGANARSLIQQGNPTTYPLKNSFENPEYSINSMQSPSLHGESNTLARNIAHQAATNTLAGTAGGIANVALDDSDDSVALKFAKGFALAVAGKVAAKHGMPAGARASKAAFDFAMQKSAQFSTLLRENPQLFTRLLNKQLTDDFAQFGGQSSGLNAERYAVAKELAQKGVSEEEILARTGWFKGLDGNWKFQLDLAKGAAYKLKEGDYHLSQLFKQESLYAAYPFLRDVRVQIARLPENVNGSFEPTTGIITLNSANNKLDFTKALCHELQHIIQKYEGFAQGSSPKNPNYWTNAGEVEARATFKGGENNPRQRLASERKEGEIIEAMNRASDSEIPNSSTLAHSQKLESAYLKDTRRIDTEALDRHAVALPKALDEQQFMAQAKTDSQGIARVETPIGDVKIHMKGAWEHINKKNTHKQDRKEYSGALFSTLQDPLFVIKQQYTRSISSHPLQKREQGLGNSTSAGSITQDSYVFFKPYKDSSGSRYLAAFAVNSEGELLHKTFFDPNMTKLQRWIQSHDDDLLYYKYDNQQDKVYSIAGQRAQTDKDAQRIKLEKRELERHIAEYENKIKTLERKINSAGDMARKNRDKNISEQERYKDLLFQTKKKYYHIPDQEASKMDFFKSLSERQKADFLNDLERLTHKSDVDLDGIHDVISRDDFWKGKYRDFADDMSHNIQGAQRNMILLKELTRLPIESQRELAEKWNATQMRANIEKTFNTQPLKEFGTNYAEYMRDGEGAIHKLRSEKQGQVSGAFYREDLEKISGNGNIDLVWGDSRFGLAHILDKHPNMTNDILGDVLQNGELKIRQNEAIQITKDNYKVILKSNWKGEPTKNKWIVTAYEDEKGLSISSKPLTEADSLASNSKEGNSKTASAADSTKGASLPSTSKPNPTTQPIKNGLENDAQYSLKSPIESLKSAQGRINGLRAFAKYLANPPAHLRGDAQRLRADSAAMRELDMHTRRALDDKANAIDSLAYQSGYPEPQYSLKNPRQKQKFAEDSVGILQQIRAKSREGMEKILNNSWVNSALGTRIYGRSFEDYRHIKDVFDKDIAENASNALLLHNKLKLLSEDTQRKMHHYMNGDTNGEDLSSELKALADSFRKEVRKETDELVRLGLLDKKTAEKWGDVYLLREYSTRMVDRVKRGLRGLKSEDYGIGLDSIHMRGKTQKVSEKKYQEMLQKGEIGDVTKGKWEVLQEPSKHEPKYVLRRDYTRSEREKMGEIDLISYSLPRTLAKIQNQKRIATLFDAISKDGDVARKLEKGAEIPSGFRRLNGEQYGALRGFVVRNEIADDIERTTNRVLGESKEILKQIAGLATYWKKFKTVHNPTSHINNMIGNVFFLGMEGNLKGIVDNEIASVR